MQRHDVGPSAPDGLPTPRSTLRSRYVAVGGLAPSMPVISSTFPALPPQPSWRIRLMISRIGGSRCGVRVSGTRTAEESADYANVAIIRGGR
jgi:hypothetical protein